MLFSRNIFNYTIKSLNIFKAEINNKIQEKRLINISLKLCIIFTPIGTETNVPRVIKKKGITLIKPIEYCGLFSIFKPANKKIKVAGKLINKPIPLTQATFNYLPPSA